MIVIALYSASRLAASRWQRRETEFDADGVHAVMGVAMAGMLVPWLSPLPASAWEAVFGIAAAWFASQAIPIRRGNTRAGWRCAHPMPHLVECLAMLYMLLALPGPRAVGQRAGIHMAGMGASTGAAASFPALAVVLAIFMIGYLAWAADQLTSLAIGRTAGPPRSAHPASRQATPHGASPAGVMVAKGTRPAAGAEGARPANPAGRPMLAPRLSACTKIAMSLGMGYMLILML
jgi:hypothetical protein